MWRADEPVVRAENSSAPDGASGTQRCQKLLLRRLPCSISGGAVTIESVRARGASSLSTPTILSISQRVVSRWTSADGG